MLKHQKKWLAGLVGASSLAVATLLPSSSAQAWSWSPNVTVMGFAACNTGTPAIPPPARATWVYVYASGEVEQQSVNWIGYWEAHLRTVPSGGS